MAYQHSDRDDDTMMMIMYKQHSIAALFVLFSERVVTIWNSLPVDTDFSSPVCFIQQINSLDFSEFCYIKCYCCSPVN